MKLGYKHTTIATYISIAVQAVINNLPPLLYVTFSKELNISLVAISALISVNFMIQLSMDLLATFFIDRLGYKRSIIIANSCAGVGLICLGTLPQIMSAKFIAILISTVIMGIGGGLMEVVASPIIESTPSSNKEGAMSLFHSYYCWGHAGIIIISTLFFILAGIDKWYILPLVWGIAPLANAVYFSFVPVNSLESEGGFSAIRSLFTKKKFWAMMLIMLSAGASELAIAEWASLFAEMGLGISKSLGDILGPCAFAICMGIGRVLFGKFSERMKLEKWLMFSFLLCVASYLLTSLSPNPYLSLVGCMLTGLSVAIMWPGTYSLGASHLPHGGTAMFAFFALAGDLGCTLGPLVIGSVSDYVIGGGKIFTGLFAGDAATVGLKSGIFVTTLFPLVAVFATLYLFLKSRKKKDISGNRL